MLKAPLEQGSPVDFTQVVEHIDSSPVEQLEKVAKFIPG